MRLSVATMLLPVALVAGCGDRVLEEPILECPESGGVCPDPLRINEVVARNQGVWIDEAGETDDWIELHNSGAGPLFLGGYRIGDEEDDLHPLPEVTLEPGAVLLLWADGEPEEGALHLPFRLSGTADTILLVSPARRLVDRVEWTEAAPNESLARLPDGEGVPVRCGWATPARANGSACGPPPPPAMPATVEFREFGWPERWPEPAGPLVLSELALRPAAFVEVQNVSGAAVDLSRYELTVKEQPPGAPWPMRVEGRALAWPVGSLEPGARIVVPVTAGDTAGLEAAPDFEGVVSLFEIGVGAPVDRVDFMAWPEGAVLARVPDGWGRHRFCANATPGEPNDACEPVLGREVPGRLRHLRTPGDFAALADGETTLGMDAVKFVVDMDAGDVVHLLGNRAWDLHYTFIRERIDGDPHLDRCDPEQNDLFHLGWARFSEEEYFRVEGRRYLLGTIVHHAGRDLWTVEFTTGDAIVASQMLRAFFAVARHVDFPTELWIRPQGSRQTRELLSVDGQAPIVDENEPFRGMTLQPLSPGVAYGTLTFVPAADLARTPLGPRVVAVTDQVPNDLPLVGGLITEAFQTPLAHVNVLSHNRGTPNMALAGARSDPRVAPRLGTLVRLEVLPGGFDLRAADPAEAEAFWASRRPTGDPLRPRLDTTVRGVRMLADLGIEDLGAVGAKAALLAELGRLAASGGVCAPVLPPGAFAVPLVHFREHAEASGAARMLVEAEADPAFGTDPRVRSERLAAVRAAIRSHPVDPALLREVTERIESLFGARRVRIRSSSNAEDLPGFNGAGLYTSASAAAGDPDRPVEDAIRAVWASLYDERAYDERAYANVDERAVAMGLLVHEAFLSERANGVVITRNILNPIRSDQYYVNAQAGEASVTNPAPGVTTEQFLYRRGRSPRLVYYARSSLLPDGEQVLSTAEADELACVVQRIHDYFQPRLDPAGENRWFAMDVEFKLVGPGRDLVIKQARPYVLADAGRPTDCREF
ncbi:MAG: hypothetical protein GYA57_00870 [Myxococcales bacterium]|nr:hypothetical protein [Myxococcales bacterium]